MKEGLLAKAAFWVEVGQKQNNNLDLHAQNYLDASPQPISILQTMEWCSKVLSINATYITRKITMVSIILQLHLGRGESSLSAMESLCPNV